jgi:nitroreductase
VVASVDLTTDELLTTTRSVRRRLDLDRPVPIELVRECLELALQAPNGGNAQRWHFLVVSDPETKRALAELNRRARAQRGDRERPSSTGEAGADYLERAPLLLVACIEGRIEGRRYSSVCAHFGSILPALWSFCLAARSRGLGTRWTTTYLAFEEEAAALLRIPYGEVSQVALVPVGFTVGTGFRPAARRPLDEALHLEHW